MEPKIRSTVCECVNVSACAHVLDECVNECTYVWRAGCTGLKILKEEAWQCTLGMFDPVSIQCSPDWGRAGRRSICAQVSGHPESWLNRCLH